MSSVREVLRGERPVRGLDIRYIRVYGHDRLASVESSLGHRVEYGYDAKGNLTSVKRSGQNVDGGPDAAPINESYEYSTANTRDPHQMTAAVGPNGERTEYAYHEAGDSIPGEGIALTWIISHKEELARQVKEFANAGPVPEPATPLQLRLLAGRQRRLHHHREGRARQRQRLHAQHPRQPDADPGAARQGDARSAGSRTTS